MDRGWIDSVDKWGGFVIAGIVLGGPALVLLVGSLLMPLVWLRVLSKSRVDDVLRRIMAVWSVLFVLVLLFSVVSQPFFGGCSCPRGPFDEYGDYIGP